MSLHFCLRRRHRRRLLFPPGLLALAGLLWLGCVAIRSWQEELMRKSVVQLTIPSLHIDKNSPFYSNSPVLLSPRALDRFRLWHDVYFNGQRHNDSINLLKLNRTVAYMQAHASRNNGIRIRFSPNAKYTHLIAALNSMLKYDVQKYWLDIKHQPTALYTFTTPPVAEKPEFVDFCGTRATMSHYGSQPRPVYWSVSYFTRFSNWLTALHNPKLKDASWYTSAVGTGTEYDITLRLEKQYWRDITQGFIASFKQPDWRIQFLLIIGMGVISWGKMKRQLQHT